MDQLEQAPAELFVGYIAEHPFSGFVRVDHPGLVIDHSYQVARMGKQRRKPPLALRRRPQESFLRGNAGIQPTAAPAFLTGHDRLARFIALQAGRSIS